MNDKRILEKVLIWYLSIVPVTWASYDQWTIDKSPSIFVRLFSILQQEGACHSLKQVKINCTAVVEYECTDDRSSDTCYRSSYTSCSSFVCEQRHHMVKDSMWNDPLPNSPIECNNGGYVHYVPGDTGLSCICPKNFAGSYCDTPICENGCMHGGTCVQHYMSTKCICPDGFTGDNCHIDSRSEKCISSSHSARTQRHCSEDNECNRWETCCMGREKGFCVQLNTTRQTCLYLGKVYYAGDRFNTSDGKYCECLPLTLKYGTIKCRNLTEDVSKNSIIHKERAPVVKCPSHPVYVPLDDNRNFATYKPELTAHNHRGEKLEVTVSKSHFTSCNCSEAADDGYLVEAVTAADLNGRRGRCEYITKVKDTTSPVFKSCPSTIYASPYQQVTWEEPVVFDNVGVRFVKLLGPYRKMSTFPVGIHLLSYIANDWQGNNSKCQFFVIIKESLGIKHEAWML